MYALMSDKSNSVNHVLVGGFGQHLNDASVCWVHRLQEILCQRAGNLQM